MPDPGAIVGEDWHAELRMDDADSIVTYQRTWALLCGSAAFDDDAQ
ncbi:hypothetical protein ACFYQ5_06280 [Streptomyces sp. NPDC005794]